jgi:hypothetical protein
MGHAREHSAEHLLLDVTKMVLVVDAYDSAHCFTPCELYFDCPLCFARTVPGACIEESLIRACP